MDKSDASPNNIGKHIIKMIKSPVFITGLVGTVVCAFTAYLAYKYGKNTSHCKYPHGGMRHLTVYHSKYPPGMGM